MVLGENVLVSSKDLQIVISVPHFTLGEISPFDLYASTLQFRERSVVLKVCITVEAKMSIVDL